MMRPHAAEKLLSVSGLETRFYTRSGTVDAVNGVSFDLERGERMAVVGESGSGKSVMAMSLVRLVSHPGRIAGGSVALDGREVMDMSQAELMQVRGRRVALIFQDPMTSLNPVLRIGEQMLPPMRRHLGLGASEAFARGVELLTQVGIPDAASRLSSYPHELSGGMRQRVLIAMALSCKPDLLIADEPTTALDVTIQAQIVALLRDLSERTGTAVLFVTHDLGLVARFAQKVAVMYAGRFVEYGSARQVFAAPQHPYSRGLLRSVPPISGPKLARLAQIEGAPPDMKALPPGCPFRARCPDAENRCAIELPELTARGDGHLAACWATAEVPWRAGHAVSLP
jgi:peptide/nickel transport system ATP-binding protein